MHKDICLSTSKEPLSDFFPTTIIQHCSLPELLENLKTGCIVNSLTTIQQPESNKMKISNTVMKTNYQAS